MILPGETDALCWEATMPRDRFGGLIETKTGAQRPRFRAFQMNHIGSVDRMP